MSYSKGLEAKVSNLENLLLDKISWQEYRKRNRKANNIFKVLFRYKEFDDFSKKVYSIAKDKNKQKSYLDHEKKHSIICKKYDIEHEFIFKTYEENGKKKVKFAVAEIDGDKTKEAWTKKKLWQYYYDQTSMEDASDSDNAIREMLLSIKEEVFKKYT